MSNISKVRRIYETLKKPSLRVKVSSIFLVLCSFRGFSQTTFNSGEVAVVEYFSLSSTSPYHSIHFSFISFVDITSGTVIRFTDDSYNRQGSNDAFLGSEGILTWTANSFIPKGTVITINDNGSGLWSTDASLGTVTETGTFTFNSSNGDQVFIYQGTSKNKNALISAITVTGSWTTSGSANASKSYQPSTIVEGVNGLAIPNNKNAQFNFASASNYFEDLKTAVFDVNNWLHNNQPENLTQDLTVVTFGASSIPTGPGGIGSSDGKSELELWLVGDLGFTPGTSATWTDQSGNGLIAIKAGSDPGTGSTYNTYGSVNLDGNDYMTATIPSNTGNKATVALAAKFSNYTSYQYSGIISATDGVTGTGDRDWNGTGHVVFMKRYDNSDNITAKRSSNYGAQATNGLNTTTTNVYQSILDGTTTHKMRANGTEYTSTNAVWSNTLGINKLTIGKRDDETAFTAGDFMEIAYYSTSLNTSQSIILDNYLSAKYGNTLAASNDIYTGDDYGYDFDVAGIGRVNVSDFHSDAQGTGIVRINNPQGLGNNEFLMWGHNLKTGKTRNTTNVPSGIEVRMERLWHVSERGDVGSVDIYFNLSGYGQITASDLRLIVNSNSDFTLGSPTSISGATLVSGSLYKFTATTAFTNNCFFTIGSIDAAQTPLIAIAPGGVSNNLEFWMMGSTGFSDKSGKNVSVSTFGDVNVTTNSTNYNPVLSFDGNGDYLITGLTLNPRTTDFTAYALSKSLTKPTGQEVIYAQQNGTGNGRILMYYNSGGSLYSFLGSTITTSIDTVELNEFEINTLISNTNGTNSNLAFYKNDLANGTSTVSPEAASGSWVIGTLKGVNTNFLNGQIAESIIYSVALNLTNRTKVNSYLAVKYGIPITGNLVASNGVQYWTNPGLTDLVVIGRDDASGLYQKQSRSENDSIRLFIDDLVSANSDNEGRISNDISFIVLSSTRTDTIIEGDTTKARMPSGLYSMFNQTWEITNYNFDDEFSIEIEWDSTGEFDINDIRMVIDTDSDLSDGTIIDGTYGVTFSIGSIIISGISTAVLPKNSSAFFSIGSVNAATPLPIELLSFSADKNENEVNIHWKTTNEINNDFFTIEKSSDGKRWEQFGTVEGAGTSHQVLDYHFIDSHPYSPLTYYRLKQTDLDGTYSFSRQIAVSFEKARTPSVYPNPSHGDYIYLDLVNYDQVTKIEVIDMLGKNLDYKINKEGDEDTVHLFFDEKLNSGQFLVKVEYLDGTFYRLKFVSF